jgi:hypothetical protein
MSSTSTTEQLTAGGETAQSNGESQRQGMLAVNDLNYILPPDLSVSVNNTYKNHFFQSSTYTNNQRAICILNSGADYGDTRCSTLNFIVELTAGAQRVAYFGKNGSILNIIRSITISSRSGDEISRTIDLNHLSVMNNGFKFSENWVKTVGQGIGYGSGLLPLAHAQAQQQFSIPLYLLSDFFAYGRLLPAMVLAGLRIEIEWESPLKAFQSIHETTNTAPAAPSTPFTYTVTNPYISLRSVQLTDGTQRALNEMSAVNGLEIVYCDYERTEASLGSTVSLQLEVRKAASRALKAFLSTRVTADTTDQTKDSFKTEDWDYKQWQWQLGSLYFPQQPVKAYNDVARLAIPESYQHTLVTFDKYKGDQTKCAMVPLRDNKSPLGMHIAQHTGTHSGTVAVATGTGIVTGLGTTFQSDQIVKGTKLKIQGQIVTVSLVSTETQITVYPPPAANITATYDWHVHIDGQHGHDYSFDEHLPWTEFNDIRTGVSHSVNGKNGTFANGRSTICCLLERSDLFNLTGVPINNSRVLSAQATFSTTATRTATVFLKYVRLARVFLNNVEVEQ